MFTWGGCAGNDKNRFDSEQQCMKSCAGQKCKCPPQINIKLHTKRIFLD